MLLLDNYPSAMENRVQELSEMITSKASKWTSVVASNHPAMASRCDRIIVMEKGKIVFDGTWQEVQKNPQFAKLYS